MAECDGMCIDSSDIGIPGYGIAYPHPGCPLHAPGEECGCGNPKCIDCGPYDPRMVTIDQCGAVRRCSDCESNLGAQHQLWCGQYNSVLLSEEGL